MKILHIVPGLYEKWNGIAVAAKKIAHAQFESGHVVELIEIRKFVCPTVTADTDAASYDEIWVHSMWTPWIWLSCRRILRAGKPLVRMTHVNLDPLRMRSKGWKKLPVWHLIERRLMNKSARIVVTCATEAEWNRNVGVAVPIEVYDLKKSFALRNPECASEGTRTTDRALHVLFLGRASDPLKGVRFLERAVEEVNGEATFLSLQDKVSTSSKSGRETASPLKTASPVELRVVSDHFGDELERDWEWCDVLCLPTLSENFGLVVAEALERGKRVITTDGAPAWVPPEAADRSMPEVEVYKGIDNLTYLRGFRDGTDEARVELLKDALLGLRSSCYMAQVPHVCLAHTWKSSVE